MNWNFNAIKIKGKFYEDITNGIMKKWCEKYCNVTIVYKTYKNQYIFFIHGTIEVIKDGNWVYQNVLLKQYNNEDAISNFATIPREKFLEEYENNFLNNFLEEQEAVVCLYKTLGMNLELKKDLDKYPTIIVTNNEISPNFSWMRNKYINTYSKFENFMFREEYKRNINALRKQISEYWDKANK